MIVACLNMRVLTFLQRICNEEIQTTAWTVWLTNRPRRTAPPGGKTLSKTYGLDSRTVASGCTNAWRPHGTTLACAGRSSLHEFCNKIEHGAQSFLPFRRKTVRIRRQP